MDEENKEEITPEVELPETESEVTGSESVSETGEVTGTDPVAEDEEVIL